MFNLGEISMKKSLVALAVLAAAGGAFAQSSVTLSGTYAFGFAANKASTFAGNVETAVKGSGFGTDTASMKLAAVEDLGGGLKLAASITAANLNRGGAVSGEDARMDLTGGFGRFSLGTIESGTGIRPLSQVDAPVFNLEGEVFAAASNIDAVAYQSASFGGVSFGLAYVDRGTASTPANTTTFAPAVAGTGTGLGFGTSGPADRQPSLTANVTYGNGPINAKLDVTAWTRKDTTEIAGSNLNNRFRISGNYDLGVVKLGAGFSQLKKTQGAKSVTEAGFGVSAPLGPVTVGAYYALQRTKDTEKRDGFTVGASYALSKRTSISSNVATWKWKDNAGNKTASGNHFELLMNHNF
jgi:predicted porin